jgi:hypothetical protein
MLQNTTKIRLIMKGGRNWVAKLAFFCLIRAFCVVIVGLYTRKQTKNSHKARFCTASATIASLHIAKLGAGQLLGKVFA